MNPEPSPSDFQKSIDAGFIEDLDTWVNRLKNSGDWNHRTTRNARQRHETKVGEQQ